MAQAKYSQPSFLGGEWSKSALGNWADPKYKIALQSCLNFYPVAPGALTRRQGTGHAGFTRRGAPGRLIPFDFEEDAPYNMEFTDGYLRYWSAGTNGLIPATTNDGTAVTAISNANPAVATLASAATWATGATGFFSGLGINNPLLQNRTFILTKVDTTHFSLADEITGTTLDGSTIGAFVSGTLNQTEETVTPYTAQAWKSLRSVQTEDTSVLLQGAFPPQSLAVTQDPLPNVFAQFSLTQSEFLDGPYLDPVPGSYATASQESGNITLTLSFQQWVTSIAYKKGDYVLNSSIGYQSLIDGNVGNTPASSPTDWMVVGFGAPVNNGQGFIASDAGRLIRIFAEPQLWNAATAYAAAGVVVAYTATGLIADTTYWTSLQASTGQTPGADTVNWIPTPANAALWTWGKIIGPSTTGLISGTLAGSTNIGNMTGNGGLAAVFDGVTNKGVNASATVTMGGVGPATAYAGKNYTGASAQTISQVVVWPSTDFGFLQTTAVDSVILNLRASNSLPSSSSNGTLLGTSGSIPSNTVAPVTIASSNTSSTWNYVWVELIPSITAPVNAIIAQAQFYSNSAAPGTSVTFSLLGPTLTYTSIRNWRIGAYSATTGYPTCGTYSDGRLWLSGAIKNRVDACYADGVGGANGDTINFSPTLSDGTVTAANAITAIFNAPDANPIFWTEPDLQGILCGTQAGEWLISAPAQGGISPLNIQAKRVTKIRCANIEPRRTEHTVVFVQAFQRSLKEYFPDVFSGKFTAPDLTEKCKHLTVSGIAEIAYQQELAPIIWMRLNNGGLVGMTYKRDTLMTSQGPTFNGGHPHTLGSGNSVVSICAGPSENGNLDALSLVTLDNTTSLYHVEYLTDMFEETDTPLEQWFCDNAVAPSSYSIGSTSVTINGLYHLNGRTCSAFIGAVDTGDWPVTNGTMTVPLYGQSGQANSLLTAAFLATFSGTIPMVIGFTYTSQGQLPLPIEPQESGARLGPAVGDLRRDHRFAAEVVNTQMIKFGTSLTRTGALHAFTFKSDGSKVYAQNVLYTGVIRDQIGGDNSLTEVVGWQVTRPFNATIGTIGGSCYASDT